MSDEILKDIVWYEWLYKVSNFWSVISLNYGKVKWNEKVLVQAWKRGWYRIVLLYKKWIGRKIATVHRLVAQAFLWLDINDTKMMVCHKDDNPLNNKIDNLFLWSGKDNMIDCSKKWRTSNQWKFWADNHLSKQVKQLDKKWNLLKIWWWLNEIQRVLWFDRASLSRVCLWKQKTSYGYLWSY